MIGYLGHRKSGCQWYRIKNPMSLFPSKEIHLNEDIQIDDLTAFQFYGSYPFSPETVLKYLKETGKRIIYDTDDALDLVDPSNPFYYSVKKDAGMVDMILPYVDHVTVSTPAMKEYISKKTDKEISVIPNCYVPSEWTFPRPTREGIRIGFAGSATHVKDLIEVLPAIQELQEKYGIIFIIMGFGHADYPTWYRHFRYSSTPEGVALLEELDRRLSKIKFEWVAYIDYDKYPTSLINMALDIGICPLKETPFDKCRSACKAMEYTLSGALALASDVTAYRNEPTSILVPDTDWQETIEFYINNPLIREESHAAHLKWIQDNRQITSQLEPLKKAYGIV